MIPDHGPLSGSRLGWSSNVRLGRTIVVVTVVVVTVVVVTVVVVTVVVVTVVVVQDARECCPLRSCARRGGLKSH